MPVRLLGEQAVFSAFLPREGLGKAKVVQVSAPVTGTTKARIGQTVLG